MSLKIPGLRKKDGEPNKIVGAAVVAFVMIGCFVMLYVSGGIGGIVFGLIMGLTGATIALIGILVTSGPRKVWANIKASTNRLLRR